MNLKFSKNIKHLASFFPKKQHTRFFPVCTQRNNLISIRCCICILYDLNILQNRIQGYFAPIFRISRHWTDIICFSLLFRITFVLTGFSSSVQLSHSIVDTSLTCVKGAERVDGFNPFLAVERLSRVSLLRKLISQYSFIFFHSQNSKLGCNRQVMIHRFINLRQNKGNK